MVCFSRHTKISVKVHFKDEIGHSRSLLANVDPEAVWL